MADENIKRVGCAVVNATLSSEGNESGDDVGRREELDRMLDM